MSRTIAEKSGRTSAVQNLEESSSDSDIERDEMEQDRKDQRKLALEAARAGKEADAARQKQERQWSLYVSPRLRRP